MVMRLSQKIGNVITMPNRTGWSLYNPPNSQGMGTLGTSELYVSEDGEDILIEGRILLGTTSAAQAQLGLPSAYTVGSQKGTGIALIVGEWYTNHTTASSLKGGDIIAVAGNNYMTFSASDTAATQSPAISQNGNAIFVSSVLLFIKARIPAAGLSVTKVQGAGISATGPSLVNGFCSFSAYASANQTALASGSTNKVAINTKDFDTATAFNTTLNRFVAPLAGSYNFSGKANINNAAAVTGVDLALYKNGSLLKYLGGYQNSANSTGVVPVSGSVTVQAVAGDYFELFVASVGTGTYNILGSATGTHFSGHKVP